MTKALKYIDAVRGYAILGVIMIHTLTVAQPTNIYLQILANKGKYGVQLFFIASAFTLFLSQKRRSEVGKKNFFIRRFFRIAPMYYLGIILYLFVFKEVSNSYNGNLKYCGESVISFFNIFSNFFFINSTNPSWCSTIVPGGATISVEMIFYLIVPFLYSKILVNDFISFIGKVSYSAYLIHFIVIYYLDMVLLRFNFPLKFVPYFIITVVVTLLASNIFRHLVENPFIRVGKYFIKKPNENIL